MFEAIRLEGERVPRISAVQYHYPIPVEPAVIAAFSPFGLNNTAKRLSADKNLLFFPVIRCYNAVFLPGLWLFNGLCVIGGN